MAELDIPNSVRDAAASIVATVCGHAMDGCRLLGLRADYYVLEATAGPQVFVVKLAGPASTEPLFRPASAAQKLAARLTSAPLSLIVAVDDTMSLLPYRYSVQTKVEGEQWFSRRRWLNEADREEALTNLSLAVAELHAARLHGFGRIAETGAVVAAPLLAALHRHADRIIASPGLRDRFHDLLESRHSDFGGTPAAGITHEDLHGFNILFSIDRPTQVSAVLDFDKAWGGPVESDIARMELWRGMTSPASLAAYRERIPMDDGYEARRPVYQLLWCYEFSETSPEHQQTTNSIEEELGLAPSTFGAATGA